MNESLQYNSISRSYSDVLQFGWDITKTINPEAANA
jgi:hypothetical protein